VVEFTSDIPYYMQLADFFIGKPGPGSISEAVRQGLPVIVVDNAWTMPQERYNAEWVRENGLGVMHGSFRTIDRAVAQLLNRFDTFQANVGRIDNQALFEIPVVLARILDQASGDMPQTAPPTVPDTALWS
jgi:UDP-N-acetylglucosamine:LPS N-acetylglucosamine transferase